MKLKFANQEFNSKLLPENRKELFADIFKLHHAKLFLSGLILLLFSIPLLVVLFLKDYSYVSLTDIAEIRSMSLMYSALEIPAIVILSIGFSGISKVFRNYCWMDPVFFKEDFLSGIKDNKIQCIFIGLTTGILAFLFNVIRIYSNSGWLDAIPFGFIFFGFYPVLIHAFFMNSIYTNKFNMNLKAGAFCYFKFFWRTILTSCLLYIFLVPSLFHFIHPLGVILKYTIIVIFMIFLLPIILLIVNLSEMVIFDSLINKEKFPQLYKKGLYINFINNTSKIEKE